MTLAFDTAYEGVPSWETGRIQPVVERLAARGAIAGSVLDAGCGTGLAAVYLAARGHTVVGIDAAARAVELAGHLGAAAGSGATFVVGDALDLATATGVLAGPFDTVLDVGLFHVLQPADHRRYAASLASVLRPGGTALVVAWSHRNPFGFGPERVTRRAIRAAFRQASGWRVESIEEEQLESRLGTGVVHAWLATVRRR
jgi:SAM-dependent methyltransferase